jgi:SpoVK/Ycf46/Vps4 family AAA+-type ATPase
MPRSDLLLNLVRTATRGDQLGFSKILEAVIADERRKQHHVLADRLAEYLTANGTARASMSRAIGESKAEGLVFEQLPRRSLDELILPESVRVACTEVIEEQHRRDLLHAYGIEPRHRLLLIGPPGNVKTTVAEAIAFGLAVPLLTVRYEGVIGSYLGETANRLRQLFDFVRTRECVLFFDEFDTIGKERGDAHETGEIKRVVSSLLLQIDTLPSYVVVVTATNHAELLDRAVWRRFQLRLELPKPTRAQIECWFGRYFERFPELNSFAPRTLADKLHGLSFAEIEEFGTDVLRRSLLNISDVNTKDLIRDRLNQWKHRASLSSTGNSPDA